ncbi:hypothetical protein ABIF38_006661 [Bradyrhizobium japonicum]|uniref:hypothetical protein n=1 Tax=Bradyrhizobium elkanii TaxID=29448 RepID=UPI003487D077
MRSALIASMILSLAAGPAVAGPRMSGPSEAAPGSVEKYRGYVFDLSENADRKDVTSIADMVRRQLDVVETAGFSPKVLQFFHRVPIVASEMACLDEGAAAACYGLTPPEWDRGATRDVTIWDHDKQQWTNSDPLALALDSGIGIIRMRPNMMRYAKEPVLLHEFLHAYHARLMPNGYENKGIKAFLSQAQIEGAVRQGGLRVEEPAGVLRGDGEHLSGRQGFRARTLYARHAQGEDAGLLQISRRPVRRRSRGNQRHAGRIGRLTHKKTRPGVPRRPGLVSDVPRLVADQVLSIRDLVRAIHPG